MVAVTTLYNLPAASKSDVTETCHDVSIEPTLQPLTGETLSLLSANGDTNARLDVAASGIWGAVADSSEHFLMCGCSTPTLPRIKPPESRQATKDMRMRREGNTNNGLSRLSIPLSSHLYLRALED